MPVFPGWMQVHYRLAFDEAGIPQLYVFRTCREFIRTIPLLQYDKVKAEDVDSDGETIRLMRCVICAWARPISPVRSSLRRQRPMTRWRRPAVIMAGMTFIYSAYA